MGAERSDLERNGVIIDGKSEDMVRHRVTRELWERIGPPLGRTAGLAERFLELS
jgi:hypothetical protein